MYLTDVVVATVLPFKGSGAIDWESFGRLLEYCATPDGISSVFVNGNAGECASLAPEERSEVITFTRRFLRGSKPILSGIVAMSTRDAITQARQAALAGADAVVLFPLPPLCGSPSLTPDAPLAYVREVRATIDLPISIFQYPLASGSGYTTETLVEMAKVPGVIAIKEGSDTMTAYEDNWRQVKAANPHVAILPSNFHWFLAQCAVGADGILSGLASLAPHLLIDLWQATRRKDLDGMRAASDRLYPVVRAIYGPPPSVPARRIKTALKHLGVFESATARLPLLPVSADIAARITRAIDVAEISKNLRSAPPIPQVSAAVGGR